MPDYLQAVIDKIKAGGFGVFSALLINRYREGPNKRRVAALAPADGQAD